jgi:hypothetical protein
MLDDFFKSPLLERLRSSGVGACIDGFAGKLRKEGYCAPTSRTHLYSAVHLGGFVQLQGKRVEFLDEETLAEFGQHVTHCQCPGPGGGEHASRGARPVLRLSSESRSPRRRHRQANPEKMAGGRRVIPAMAEAALRRFGVDAETV